MAEEVITPDVQPATVKDLSGFDDGEILSTGEVVRGSYDEHGKLVGWHKDAPLAE